MRTRSDSCLISLTRRQWTHSIRSHQSVLRPWNSASSPSPSAPTHDPHPQTSLETSLNLLAPTHPESCLVPYPLSVPMHRPWFKHLPHGLLEQTKRPNQIILIATLRHSSLVIKESLKSNSVLTCFPWPQLKTLSRLHCLQNSPAALFWHSSVVHSCLPLPLCPPHGSVLAQMKHQTRS